MTTNQYYQEHLLRAAHFRELAKRKIDTAKCNLGWSVSERAYLSKTPAGIIQTTRLETGKYSHKVVS
jgi:hypothetical protein